MEKVGENRSNISFEEGFNILLRRFLCEEVNTSYPAVIESYDYEKQEADVKILVKRKYKDGTELEFPVVTSVPVVMPRTQSAMIKLPIKKGDMVLLMFTKSSLDDWLVGGKTASVSPSKQFRLTDAVALVGFFPFGKGAQGSDNDSLEIVNEGQTIKIKASGDIEIGGANLKALVTEDLIAKFNSHVHTGVTTGTSSSGAPATPITSSVLTTKTKAE